ncbi:Arogenate dehydratase protein [Dioscorea alata]|uniref:Arogenate dehydratase protein n=1 Tax=Dioscorea alata TaxID=55571 RepID=A0ACB7UNK5_DIOAL|nr:Arogenate dehydratase protein [Dioscorea alata]
MLDGGKMISLDGVGILGGGGGLICLKRRDLGRSYGVCFLKWRYGRPLCAKPVEDESVPVPISAAELSRVAGNAEALERGRWNRESNALPRQLSATDLVAPSQGLNIRVAYQGLPGAFSEAAALKAYPLCETVPCEEFDVTFKAVEMSVVDRAVLPIENSSDGSIHRNYDLLLSHRLHIVGEVQLAVNHCLMALPGVKKEGIKRVLSHPNALAQCEFKLNKLEVIQQNMHDTAGAAQDLSDNVTRFLILAREPIIPGTDRPFKTSIVFTLDEGPGVLFKALAVFSLRNISLTKIESRPQRKRPLKVVTDSNHGTAKYFDYLFYIDFEASMIEPRAQNALAHLQEFATFLHVLGSYPKDTSKCFSQEKL